MAQSRLESALLELLKRFMLLVIGSSLLSNALYIYGLSYYEGFIERLGFEYYLFPIAWNDALLWTYTASRDLGEDSIVALGKTSPYIFLSLLPAFYFIARLWMHLSSSKAPGGSGRRQRAFNYKLAKKIHRVREDRVWIYRTLYVPLRWFLMKEQSFIAFFASYFFMVFLLFIPMFVIVWVYFPLFGFNHGEASAEKRLKYYEESLCGGESSYWNKCLHFSAEHLSAYEGSDDVTGRVALKNGDLLGVMSLDGPIVLTMPEEFFYKAEENVCYNGGCDDK